MAKAGTGARWAWAGGAWLGVALASSTSREWPLGVPPGTAKAEGIPLSTSGEKASSSASKSLPAVVGALRDAGAFFSVDPQWTSGEKAVLRGLKPLPVAVRGVAATAPSLPLCPLRAVFQSTRGVAKGSSGVWKALRGVMMFSMEWKGAAFGRGAGTLNVKPPGLLLPPPGAGTTSFSSAI